ncbi:MAG: PIN domain-containing protein [Planctomycetaceae bacterium]
MSRPFADTFYFIALLNPGDAAHAAAAEWTDAFDGGLVTTAWVLTELADGMSAPVARERVGDFIRYLRADIQVEIVPPSETIFEAGISLYESRPDKHWSLTDCISFVVMQKHGLTDALTGDHHFEQAGFTALLK